MPKLFFADRGAKEGAFCVLSEVAAHAQELNGTFKAITASYQDGPGPFPERLHVGSLIGRLLYEHAEMLARWARWAGDRVDHWPSSGPEAAHLGRSVQEENAELAAGLSPSRRAAR